MSEQAQSLPGIEAPTARPKRGRPPGARTRKLGALFADGSGDYRLYVVEEAGGLTPVADSGGHNDCAEALRWLKTNGGREDLLGRQILVMRGLHLVRLAMTPQLQFKPRGKMPVRPKLAPPPKVEEPATVST